MVKIKTGYLVAYILIIIILTALNVAVLSTLQDVNDRMIELEYLIDEQNEKTNAVMTVHIAIKDYIRKINPAVSGDQAVAIATAISTSSAKNNIDPYLYTGLAHVESSFITTSVSYKNARGLIQILPKTFQSVHNGDINNLEDNVEAGARYLRSLIDRFGDTRLALAAYNCGPSRSPKMILSISGRYADKVLKYSKNIKQEEMNAVIPSEKLQKAVISSAKIFKEQLDNNIQRKQIHSFEAQKRSIADAYFGMRLMLCAVESKEADMLRKLIQEKSDEIDAIKWPDPEVLS
jgi:hypothetical protein